MMQYVHRILSIRYIRNIGWMGLAELGNRATRLVAAIALARSLDPLAFGVAATAITTHELIRVLTATGFGAKIVQSNDEELEQVCQTVFRLNLLLGICLFLAQLAVSLVVATIFETRELAYMIGGLSLCYLIYPFALVHVYRVQRQQHLHLTAATNAAQVGTDNLLTAALAIAGFGPWSVILPKIVVAPLWVIFYLAIENWRPRISTTLYKPKAVIGFGASVLGGEVVNTLRVTLDKFIIGYFLGLDVLGIYYFAYNAGVGITIALVNAFGNALLPHICQMWRESADRRCQYLKAVLILGLVTSPIVLLQAIAAPVYVPLIFGEQWTHAVPIISILCLSALSRPLLTATSQLLRAVGSPQVDFQFALIFTVLTLAVVLGTISYGLLEIAIGILILSLTAVPAWFVYATIRFTPPSIRPLGAPA